MSRSRKKLRRPARAPERAAGGVPAITLGEDVAPEEMAWAGNGIAAADYSTARGWVYFPELRGKLQFTRYSRLETIRRCQWLVWNMGAARVIRRLARWVGAVSVTPATEDLRWNKMAAEWWRETYSQAVGNYDVSGKLTPETFLANQMFLAFRDGDALGMHVVGEDGQPMVAAYESTAVQSPQEDRGAWLEGVKLDRHHRAVAFCIRDGDNDRFVEVPAASCHLFANYESHASVRGTPALVHAVTQLLDMREIDNDVRAIIKAHGLVGFAMTKEAAAGAPPVNPVSGRGRREFLPAGKADPNAPPGAPEPKPSTRMVNEVFSRGEIIELPPGVDMKTLTDGRDWPVQEGLKEDIYLQIALGLGVPVELLFLLDRLTGPGIRFVLRQAQSWRESWLDQQVPFVMRDYAIRVEWAIRKRILPRPKDPKFWSASVRYPRAVTIDAGRETAGQIAKLKAGLTNWETEYGEEGEDWRQHVAKRVEELAFAIEECRRSGVPLSLLLDGTEGAAAAEEVEDVEEPPPPRRRGKGGGSNR